jgi:hypothetical protein
VPDVSAARKAALEAVEQARAMKPDTDPPPSGDGPNEDPVIEAREVTLKPRRQKSSPGLVAVTLLDGTTIHLPARKQGDAPAPENAKDDFTARDFISALRAVSHGADMSDILGKNPRWEEMFAALLSVMLRKGLIADWEFIEELRRV